MIELLIKILKLKRDYLTNFKEKFRIINVGLLIQQSKLDDLLFNKDYQKQTIGTQLIDFIKTFFVNRTKIGCRFITVDAYHESLGFYEKRGFKFLTETDKNDETRLMNFDLFTFRP